MYHFTDFVTNLPIVESDNLYISFFVQESFTKSYMRKHREIEEVENSVYADSLYCPVTYPFIVRYSGHGSFSFAPEFNEINEFAWREAQKSMGAVFDYSMPTEFNHEQFGDKTLLSVSSYGLYLKTVVLLQDMEHRQGVFRLKGTYRETFENNFKECCDELDRIASEEQGQRSPHINYDVPTIADVTIDSEGKQSQLSFANYETQIAIRELMRNDESTIPEHLFAWSCFQHYVNMLRKSYGPVAGMGSQSEDLDIHLHLHETALDEISMMKTLLDEDY